MNGFVKRRALPAPGSIPDVLDMFPAEVRFYREVALTGHDGPVKAVAFSLDGTKVATGSGDRSARVFEATSDLLVQRAIGVMARPLNFVELRRYLLPSNCLHVERWNLWLDHARPKVAG